ncbi:MAG: sigma-70 family RNA polymerase sigma factor [Pseudomonadales bacterium]
MEAKDTSTPDWAEHLAAIAFHQDREAFARLFKHYAPKLKSYALSTATSGVSLAQFSDELVQEVMVKVWQRAVQFDSSKAGATTWIFTIARNTRIDLLRRQNRHSNHMDADDVWLEAHDGDPDTEFQQKRTHQVVREAVSQLPVEQSQVIAKVYLEGKSHSEVAEELGLPLGTVKSRVRLAMGKMKVLLEQ